MTYTLTITYDNGKMFKEIGDLPTVMGDWSFKVDTDPNWTYAELVSDQTGEVLAAWRNDPQYGLTCI